MYFEYSSQFTFSLLIGLLTMVAVYIGLKRAYHSLNNAIMVFAILCGIITMLWLQNDNQALEQYSMQIAIAGIAVVLALLLVARRGR